MQSLENPLYSCARGVGGTVTNHQDVVRIRDYFLMRQATRPELIAYAHHVHPCFRDKYMSTLAEFETKGCDLWLCNYGIPGGPRRERILTLLQNRHMETYMHPPADLECFMPTLFSNPLSSLHLSMCNNYLVPLEEGQVACAYTMFPEVVDLQYALMLLKIQSVFRFLNDVLNARQHLHTQKRNGECVFVDCPRSGKRKRVRVDDSEGSVQAYLTRERAQWTRNLRFPATLPLMDCLLQNNQPPWNVPEDDTDKDKDKDKDNKEVLYESDDDKDEDAEIVLRDLNKEDDEKEEEEEEEEEEEQDPYEVAAGRFDSGTI